MAVALAALMVAVTVVKTVEKLVGLKAAGLRNVGAMLGADAESDIFSRVGAKASSVRECEPNRTSGLLENMGVPLGVECAF